MLQRTQLMLDDELKRDLVMLAEYKNQSISQLVRTFVADRVKKEKKTIKKSKKINAVETLLKFAKETEKIAKKYGDIGPTDWSINHDHYLYGAPKVKP